ncbi:MAG TPA: hypothetical protein ACQGQJ_07325 [Xylella fastidiosa subsp. multiplex]
MEIPFKSIIKNFMGELTGLKADLAPIVRLALAEQAGRAAAQDELAFAADTPKHCSQHTTIAVPPVLDNSNGLAKNEIS